MNLLWIYDIPNWASLVLIVGSTLAVGCIGLFALRSWVSRLHSEQNHNEIVSYFLAAACCFTVSWWV
jgi:multisubunit Na+/H+ antiporter MnhG subunit